MENYSSKTSEVAVCHCTDGIKLYARRWFLLGLFMLFTANVAVHWMQFSTITNLVSLYYNVPPTWVEWTSIMVMAGRAFILFPSLFLIDKLETKNTLIMACTISLIGSCIKTFSVSPDRFYVAFIGQMFSALALVFTYSLIGRFSATWFSSSEISTAASLGTVGENVGGSFGFLLPTRFVPDTADVKEFEKGMQLMHYFYSAWGLLTLILITLFFKSKPKRPPSAAQQHTRSQKSQRVHSSLKKLIKNPRFLLFVLTQGIFVGSGCNAINTLLNEMIVKNFPGGTAHTGTLGCASLSSGIVGSVILSYVQDRTRKFKCMAVTLSFANCISFAFFAVSLKMGNIIYVYITFIIYGFLMQAYYATTLQMGIELTFPVPEGVTVAAISVLVEICSMISTAVYGLALKRYGDWKLNICVTILLLLAAIGASLVPPKFKREELERAAKAAEAKTLLYGSKEKTAVTASNETKGERSHDWG